MPPGQRLVICVFGLARGCGATVVARALAAELATRDPAGAAAVCCEARPAAIPLATHAATRLARALADVPGASPRAVGRLCLVSGADPLALSDTARYFAPLVIDAGSDALGGAPASLADRTVLVSAQSLEPALAQRGCRVHRARCARAHRRAESRPARPDRRHGAAELATGCPARARRPRGPRRLGRAIAELADLCEAI